MPLTGAFPFDGNATIEAEKYMHPNTAYPPTSAEIKTPYEEGSQSKTTVFLLLLFNRNVGGRALNDTISREQLAAILYR